MFTDRTLIFGGSGVGRRFFRGSSLSLRRSAFIDHLKRLRFFSLNVPVPVGGCRDRLACLAAESDWHKALLPPAEAGSLRPKQRVWSHPEPAATRCYRRSVLCHCRGDFRESGSLSPNSSSKSASNCSRTGASMSMRGCIRDQNRRLVAGGQTELVDGMMMASSGV